MIQEQTGGLSYGFIPINNETSFNESKKLVISNSSKKMKKYAISVEYNVGAQGSLDAEKNGVNVNLSEDSFKVKSGTQKELSVSLTVPKTTEKGTYEGYIRIENEKNPEENYQIPFGARVVEEGFKYFATHSPSISNNRVIAQYSVKDTDLDFNLNSPMKTIDFVLVDPKTDKDLGLITSINTSVDENGKFSKEISVTGSSSATMLQFVGADRAGNSSVAPKVIYYVKAGSQYIYAKPNKDSITMGDKITYTLFSHGLKNAKEMSFSLNYLNKYFDSVGIEKTKHYQMVQNLILLLAVQLA
ncbi:hypothetical protein COJ46_20045 [Bacillus sp. AFS077874]|uniref:Fn3-like domain-containing protein n=1 Tax=unclassified Bacillus (in: firmicutes) TaxID=185979 RepID=UPI000BEB7CA6|nr:MULTISPECIES: Fn3-like domain-containing protein [unclassified Bacillus (in: firmicutes)]PEC47367.1 hypothetical protein CON00_21950 [Bacillus sp. AFS096315]PFM76063.1 hypothetical protein COJ46_20045 [Bacillus sp. AFS077874]